jgi:hypothetical protein
MQSPESAQGRRFASDGPAKNEIDAQILSDRRSRLQPLAVGAVGANAGGRREPR